MSKKDNNKRAKEAIKNKVLSEEILSSIGLNLSDELLSVGVIFDNLEKSSINLCLISSINKIFEDFAGISISVFTHKLTGPCVLLFSPILELKFLFGWTDPLVCVSASTAKSALNTRARFIYNLVSCEVDEKYIKENSEILYNNRVTNILIKPEQEEFFKDSKIIKIYDRFDFNKIIKYIVGDLKNGKKE